MPDIDVSDYSIFDNAINTTNTLSNVINDSKTKASNCSSKLNNESVFMGPICNECVQALSNVDSKLVTMTNSFSDFISYYNETKEKYKTGDNSSAKTVQLRKSDDSSLDGQVNLDGNVIDVSKPVEKGQNYNLSDDDLNYLASVAVHEQGSVEGAKMELSLMANLYEQNKNNYSDVRDYVTRSGWFAGNSLNYSYPGDEYVDAARDVLNDGNLYVPSNVNEHDCLSDIESISTGDPYNRDDYIPGETVITNTYGAVYTFVGFAPNDGDPFGYK